MSKVFYVYHSSDKFKFVSGPTRVSQIKTDEQKMLDEVHDYLVERSKQCCKICGVYLELNEINEKMFCSVCYDKKVDK